MSVRQDILDWFIGEDKTFEFTIFQADGVTLQDITGWTFEWKVAPSVTAAATLTKAGAIVAPATGGIVDVVIARVDTTGLTAGTYYHGLSRTDSGSWTLLTFGTAILQESAEH